MADLLDGETTEMKGSGKKPYILRNIGGVYDCSCPAWRNQSHNIDMRTCKHLVSYLGDQHELSRVSHSHMPTAWKKKHPQVGATSTPVVVKKGGRNPEVKKATAPAILLAHSWDNAQDVTDWWISEKLDGVRAYWDGKQFVSRLGNVYHAPDYFTAGLPTTPLDGELWIGRGQFQETVSVVRRLKGGDNWKKVQYLVFDAPEHGGTFEDRYDAVEFVVSKATYAWRVTQTPCAGVDHLRAKLAEIEAKGGEGLMLREPGSLYVEGRSTTLLKVKSFFDDEATILGHTKGRGRHKGRCGALLVKNGAGVEFSVGTGLSDKQRDNPPPVGAVVSYRYQELTKAGVPRFPSFVGVRYDVKVS